MPSQECPLCESSATFSSGLSSGHDYGERKKFSCPNCTEFKITDSAEAVLKNSSQTVRIQYSEKAKATPKGQILLIRVPDRHQPDAANKEALCTEYEPR